MSSQTDPTTRSILRHRRPLDQPDWPWAIAWTLLLMAGMAVILATAALAGCATHVTRIRAIEGKGSIDVERCELGADGAVLLETCFDVVGTSFTTEGQTVAGDEGPELVHCAQVDRLEALGLDVTFLAGIVSELSDARCEGVRSRPFP